MSSADNASEAVKPHLEDDEELLWAGQPRQGIVLRPYDVIVIPFGVILGGMAVQSAWEEFQRITAAETVPTPELLGFIAACLFIPVAIYIAGAHYIVNMQARRRTWYAVTDRRVLIRTPLPFVGNTEYRLANMADPPAFVGKPDGSGDIIMDKPKGVAALFSSNKVAGNKYWSHFMEVPEGQRVYDILMRARRLARDED